MSAFVGVPGFPAVPSLPGVPALLRSATGLVGNLPVLEIADAVGLGSFFSSTQWGLYDQNMKPVVTVRSIVSVDFRGEYELVDYPIEQGGFQTYNKVIVPYDIQVVMSRDGFLAQREAFVQALFTARASLDLYQFVTPEYVFKSVNIVHVDFQRTAQRNANMIEVDITLRQVNVGSTAVLSNSASGSGADPVNAGTTQAFSGTQAQYNALPEAEKENLLSPAEVQLRSGAAMDAAVLAS